MKIFLSYEWGSAYNMADAIQEAVKEEYCFEISRDINLRTTADIFAFMQTIRQHDCLIVIITPEYLEKLHCMHELILFSKETEFAKRIIPIIVNGADIFTANGRNKIQLFWEQFAIPDDNDDFYRIRREISGNVLQVLEDVARINAVMVEPQSQAELARLCSMVKKNLFQRQFSYELRDGYIETAINLCLDNAPVLCIDFGTSYTLAAVQDVFGTTHLIPDLSRRTIMPSVITFLPQNKYAIGNLAERYSSKNVTTIRELKRLIGKCSYVQTDTIGGKISVKSLLSIFFTSIKRNADAYAGADFNRVILSIPTSFAVAERNVLTEAAKIAGLNVRRIIQEASLPSLCIAENDDIESDTVMIFDVGGGTTDCSLVEIGDGIKEILLTQGDRFTGSIDIDKAVANYIVNELSAKYNNKFDTLLNSWVYHQILQQAEMVKIAMNSMDIALVSIELLEDYQGNVTYFTLPITKAKFEEITLSVLKKFENFLLSVKREFDKQVDQEKKRYGSNRDRNFERIFLTGQGSKLYLIKELLYKIFPNCYVLDSYAENAVVNGLAEEAGMLQGNGKSALLLDVIHINFYVMSARLDDENTIYIDSDSSKNIRICELVSYYKSIPRESVYRLKFCGDVSRQFVFSIFCNTDESENSILKSFSVTSGNSLYLLNINIDANSNFEIKLHSSLDEDFEEYDRCKRLLARTENPPTIISRR